MKIIETATLITLAAADAAQHGREIEPGVYLTAKGSGPPGQQTTVVETVAQGPIEAIERISKSAFAGAGHIHADPAKAGENAIARAKIARDKDRQIELICGPRRSATKRSATARGRHVKPTWAVEAPGAGSWRKRCRMRKDSLM